MVFRSRPVDFDLGVKYVENSISIDSPEFRRIQEAASENAIAVALGFSERAGDSVYIAQALISETGDIASKLRLGSLTARLPIWKYCFRRDQFQ
jgi:nitrilase